MTADDDARERRIREYRERNRDIYGNLPETGQERADREAKRKAAGQCQRSRYCRKPLGKHRRYCPACEALMEQQYADTIRENQHYPDPPEDLAACPHADDFGSP